MTSQKRDKIKYCITLQTAVKLHAPDNTDLEKETRYTYENVTCHVKSTATNNL